MLTESRDLAARARRLVELQAEAMEWRISALIALGDLEAAREELAVVFEMASRVGQPFIIHVAEHYRSAIALCDGPPGRGGGDGRAIVRVGPAAHRPRPVRLLRHPDVRHPARAGPAGRARPGGADHGMRRISEGGAWGPGLAALLAELGMHDEARRELRRVRRRGLVELRAGLWLAALTYLADACSLVGDDRMAADLYAELTPARGQHRDDRPRRRLLWVGRPVSGHGRRRLRRARPRPRAPRDRRRGRPRNGRLDVARPLPVRARPRCSSRAPAATPRAATRCCRKRARWPSGSGCRRSCTAFARDGRSRSWPRQSPDGLSPRELQILQLVARGMSNREIGTALVVSEHTAANHVRSILRKTGCANRTEAAAYAYRRGLTAAPRSE